MPVGVRGVGRDKGNVGRVIKSDGVGTLPVAEEYGGVGIGRWCWRHQRRVIKNGSVRSGAGWWRRGELARTAVWAISWSVLETSAARGK